VLVVEVGYDHWSGGRFRHGTRFVRWRPDKDPKACTYDQVEKSGPREEENGEEHHGDTEGTEDDAE
jgi:ATP-dependent DNA ligase